MGLSKIKMVNFFLPTKIVIVTKLLDDIMKQQLITSCSSITSKKDVQFQRYKIVEVDVEA